MTSDQWRDDRNSNIEIRNKHEIEDRMTKYETCFALGFQSFGFVWSFDIRISNFVITLEVCRPVARRYRAPIFFAPCGRLRAALSRLPHRLLPQFPRAFAEASRSSKSLLENQLLVRATAILRRTVPSSSRPERSWRRRVRRDRRDAEARRRPVAADGRRARVSPRRR